MRPLLCLNSISDMSVREIDNVMEELARSGYRGAVLPGNLPWEQLRGFCRSAARYGAVLWLEDDRSPLSGSGGGEITSVHEFSPFEMVEVSRADVANEDRVLCERGEKAVVVRSGSGLWGADPFAAFAVEDFADLVYGSLKRELSRFAGHELKGVVTRFSQRKCYPFSPELFKKIEKEYAVNMEEKAESLFFEAEDSEKVRKCFETAVSREFCEACLKRLYNACKESGLELIGLQEAALEGAEKYVDVSTAFVDFKAMSFAQRQREVNTLFSKGKKGVAAACTLAPDFGEKLWCDGIECLSELLQGKPEKTDTDNPNISAVCFRKDGKETYFFVNTGEAPEKCEFEIGGQGSVYAVDFISKRVSAVNTAKKLAFTLEIGGSLVLICKGELEADGILPAFTATGAVFADFSVESAAAELIGYEDNCLPLAAGNGRYSFDAKYVEGDMYIEAENASYVKLNGLTAQACEIDVSGKVRMGLNTLETDGENPCLYGRFSVEGGSILPPQEASLGDVRSRGMAYYNGPLRYRASMPENCGGKYLRLEGGFNCAAVKIGRRKEALIFPPFMLPLYSSDEGRTAEIIIFPVNEQNDVTFGLDAVNIVSAL